MVEVDKTIKAIGIAGGSGTGKTTLANQLATQLGNEVAVLSYDDYFIPRRRNSSPGVCEETPDVFDTEAFIHDLTLLKAGSPIITPRNLRRVSPSDLPRTTYPKKLLVVEGCLILYDQRARELFDKTFFVDLPEDEMIRRKIGRRNASRPARHDSDEFIEKCFIQSQRRYIQPQRAYADVVLNGLEPTALLTQRVIGSLQRR